MSDLQDHLKNFLCDKLYDRVFGDDEDDLNKALLHVQANDEFESKITPRTTAPSLALAPSRALSTTSAACSQPNPLPASASPYKFHPYVCVVKNTTMALHKLQCGYTEIRATLLTNYLE